MNTYQFAQSHTSLARAMLRFPKAPWDDALSIGQMQSKAWAVEELVKAKKKLGMVYILGGWLGTMGLLLLSEPRFKIEKIRSFDIDPICQPIADQLNIENVIMDWYFKAITKNMFDIDYNLHKYEIALPGGYFDNDKKFLTYPPAQMTETPDTIINTSCDHVVDFSKWWSLIPKGKTVLLQNNNFKAGGDDHVNTVETLQKFADMAPMSKIMFAGERDFARYRRFMLIGTR